MSRLQVAQALLDLRWSDSSGTVSTAAPSGRAVSEPSGSGPARCGGSRGEATRSSEPAVEPGPPVNARSSSTVGTAAPPGHAVSDPFGSELARSDGGQPRARGASVKPRSSSTVGTAAPPGHAVSDPFSSDLARSARGREDGGRALALARSGLTLARWHGLVVAVSRGLAQRLSDAAPVSEGRRAVEMVEFVHTDATGGGSQMEIHLCLKGALEAMELSDTSTSLVLVGAYYYLQADDVLLTTRTWRSLVVTSLLAAADGLRGRAERDRAVGRLRRSAAHWWPEDRVDRALHVFRLRDAFVRDPPSRRKISALCSELRARAPGAPPPDDGGSSGLAFFGLARDPVPKRSAHVKARSRSPISDGYTSDHSVISI